VFQVTSTAGVKQAVLLVGHDVDTEAGVAHMIEGQVRLLYIYLEERGNRASLEKSGDHTIHNKMYNRKSVKKKLI
jgi:hypothetical protein